MEVGQGPNWGCSAKEKKKVISSEHSGRVVLGMKCLRPFEHWGRDFESHSRHGCLSVYILFLLDSGLATG
jgi:hypothetical protein